jgi:protein transport protein SEC24
MGPPAAKQLPPRKKAAVKKRAQRQYATSLGPGGQAAPPPPGGAPGPPNPIFSGPPNPTAPAMYVAPAVQQAPGMCAPTQVGQTPAAPMQTMQTPATYNPGPMVRSSAPDFGQNSNGVAAAKPKGIDVNKIPRPTTNPTHVARYRTDVSNPDFATSVPCAGQDFVCDDVGSASPRFIRLTMQTLPADKDARNKVHTHAPMHVPRTRRAESPSR